MSWLPLAILAAPLAVAVFLLFFGRRLHHGGDGFATGVMALCFAGSLVVAADVLAGGAGREILGHSVTWMTIGGMNDGSSGSLPGFVLTLGVYLDPLAAIMLCIVTGLALAVMVYTRWYLHGDNLYPRFWWSFSFFCFAMIGVVISSNLLMSFVFWELVGLGSYLLIGFWYFKPAVADDPHYQAMKASYATGILESKLSPADAQLKAFVMNRIGDAGFIAGIALTAWAVIAWHGKHGTPAGDPLAWSAIFKAVEHGAFNEISLLGLSGTNLLTLAGLGIFCGAVGKSAQFPLHTWLPDAMQGPTTGSAIIHAATMVAAGVFLVARVHPMLTPDALLVVACIGAVTALLAATMACVQWDLKAVLAYSTISQLGFMLVGLGSGVASGGYNAGIAHLFTHAIFKCLLFLCAAAVIHACHGHQSLTRVGGLGRKMPVTAFAMGVAVLAILGVPGFSAFFSKDAILVAAQVAGHHGSEHYGWVALVPAVLATLAAALTCYYMARLWWRLFVAPAADSHVVDHAHDPWPSAKLVLIVLALGCLQAVWTLQANPFAVEGAWLDHVIRAKSVGLYASGVEVDHDAIHHAHGGVVSLAITFAAVGIALAWTVFVLLPRRGLNLAERCRTTPPLSWVWALLSRLWFLEYVYDFVFVRILGKGLGRTLAEGDLGTPQRLAALDAATATKKTARFGYSLDGLIDGVAKAFTLPGRAGNLLHSGRIGTYVALAIGVVAVISLLRL